MIHGPDAPEVRCEERADYSDCGYGDGENLKLFGAVVNRICGNYGYRTIWLLFCGVIVFAVALGKVAGVVNFPADGFRVVDGLPVVTAAALFVVNDSCHTLTIA